MNVIVSSRETIKPLSPTPKHLRRLQLSLLDQITNQNWMPLVYFYANATNHLDITSQTHLLKKSLSQTLTKFYPLAGRIKNNLFIDCNDMGVPFFEAQVKCQLSHVLANANINLNKLFPYYDQLDHSGDKLLAIQLNIFDCGGIAIGTCFSHKSGDASSMITFLNSWAAIARAGHSNVVTSPKFDLATLFPPKDLLGHLKMSHGIIKENAVSRKFVFGATALSNLKTKYVMNKGGLEGAKFPSRVEAVITFISSRFMAVTQGDAAAQRFCMVTLGVNLRTRMNPSLPLSYFGNLSHFVVATPSMDKTTEGGHGLITPMRSTIRKLDINNYIKELQEKNRQLVSDNNKPTDHKPAVKIEETPHISFNSLCTFPLYEADFGWGRPVSLGTTALPFKNSVSLLPTRLGDGIEAWISMKEDDMAKLEADKEFLALTSSTLAGDHVPLVSSL